MSPAAGLDPAQIAIFRQLIRSLAGNHTILVSTHIMAEVEACCDRVVMIHQGRNLLDESVAAFKHGAKNKPELRLRLQQEQATAFAEDWQQHHPDDQLSIVSSHLSYAVPAYRPRCSAACAARHGGIAELLSEQRSLEEVFSQLIGAQTAGSTERITT